MFSAVMREWERWRRSEPHQHAEAFIAYMEGDPLWPAVVYFIAARLAEPDQVRLEHELRYGERLTKPSPNPLHHRLLARVLHDYELVGVVTTNYDLLAERTLRHRPMLRPPTPGFHYVAIPGDALQGSSTFSARHKWVEVTGTVPLCKLHGSLNWTVTGDGLRAYVDCRPAFRLETRSYIVAPKPEKDCPAHLRPVWEAAAAILGSAEEWFVVGYSAPEYDVAACDLVASAARQLGRVWVVDTNEEVANRYTSLTARAVTWVGDLEAFVGHA
jgi:hypothetical protein